MMMESIADTNGKCPTLPKTFNSKTGKQSIATVAFNGDGWGHALRLFTTSTIKIPIDFQVQKVAKEFSKGNTHILESLAPEAP